MFNYLFEVLIDQKGDTTDQKEFQRLFMTANKHNIALPCVILKINKNIFNWNPIRQYKCGIWHFPYKLPKYICLILKSWNIHIKFL